MSTFHNRTRTATSIPRKLVRDGKPYLVPLYYLLQTSELAREGIENSGSYRFADHIYGARPKGRLGIGRLLDAVFLQMKSAQALRARYVYAKREIMPVLLSRRASGFPTDVLAVPCGLARELFELAEELRERDPSLLAGTHFHGLDLDEELICTLRERSLDRGFDFSFRTGDALSDDAYPGQYDVILSTGFTEFLEDDQVVRFYRIALDHLKLGGTLITSGLARHPFSDFLLRNLADLHTHYRSEEELRVLAAEAGLMNVSTYQDRHQLQTMLIGIKA